MGTHCYIAIEDADGSVRFIFCHFDGYLRYMIPILKKDYMSRERVDALIQNGGIMSLEHMERHSSPMHSPIQVAADRWTFKAEWRSDKTIPYMYLFTRDNTWVVYCNRSMTLDEIM